MLIGTQQNLIQPNDNLRAILEFICGEANKLTNCGIYYARQLFFKTHKYVGKFDLNNQIKSNKHFQAMHSQAAQQTLQSVAESFKSYKTLAKDYRDGKLANKPRLPNYRKPGLAVVSYPRQALKLVDGVVRVPLGTLVNTWFKLKYFEIPLPGNFPDDCMDFIKELRILPRNGCFYAEWVYQTASEVTELDQDNALGIDHGLTNWLTCVSNVGTSFIIDGLHLKSINRWYNKQVSRLKDGKPQGFWTKKLAHITEKRNRQMRDAVNKAARLVINHCVDNNIGTIVFGWNTGQKDGANMGKQTNQKFVQIPTARLKDRIKQLCEVVGIRFIETEESYTSKASCLDGDSLPTFGEKPEGWQSSGKRIQRGLYRSAGNWRINADCNGAANIMRKVSMELGLDLSKVCRGALTRPTRYRFWRLVTAKKVESRVFRPTRNILLESPALSSGGVSSAS